MGTQLTEERKSEAGVRSGRQAQREVIVDDADTRVTFWHFQPGDETGWHKHDHDYVVINLTDAYFHQFVIDGRETHNVNRPRDTHAHPAGVEHNVRNEGSNVAILFEIEYKRPASTPDYSGQLRGG